MKPISNPLEFWLAHLQGKAQSADAARHERPQVLYANDFSLKRVVMHAVCLLRRPRKAAFFFAGIRREFSFLL